ncbi:hypothetical protein P3S68_030705 [Capsicum galapagoense]
MIIKGKKRTHKGDTCTLPYFMMITVCAVLSSQLCLLAQQKKTEEKIRVAASETEDVIEMKISQIIKGVSWTLGILQHEDLLPIAEKMDTTKKQVMEILSHNADQILQLSEDSLLDTSSTSYPILSDQLEDDVMHGLDDDFEIIVNRLIGRPRDLEIVIILGMGGIGKTTLAKKAYDHLRIRYHFSILVWVTVSQGFRRRNVLLQALHCISKQTVMVNAKDYDKMYDNELADLVQKSLKGPRYLIVVDDIWSTDAWHRIRRIFPNYNNSSRILFITGETEVAMYADTSSPHEMNLLNSENGWKLLRDKAFRPNNNHPLELEEIGKEIVEKCQGLPLTISVIAEHLSKMVRTIEGWKDVARTLREVLAKDFQVETWRLIQLWIAEGSIRTSGSRKSLEEVAIDYLEELISRYLIHAKKRRFNGEIKACGIHDLPREFSLIGAVMTKHMHVGRTYVTLPSQKHTVRHFSFQTLSYSVDDCYNLLPPVARSFYLFSQLNLPLEPRIELLGILPIYRHDPIIHVFFLSFQPSRGIAHLQYRCKVQVISTRDHKVVSFEISPNSISGFPDRLLDMSSLRKLEIFKCFWNIRYSEGPIISFVFPSSLKRPTLSRCLYFPWEDILSTVIMLPNLEELKIKGCLVGGDVWILSDKDKFKSLKLLLLNNVNLKRWEASSNNFPNQERLVLNYCDILQEIPTDFRLYDCSTTAEDSARQIVQEHEDMGNNSLKVLLRAVRTSAD